MSEVPKPLDYLRLRPFVVTKLECRVWVLLGVQNRYKFLDLNASTRMNFGGGEWLLTRRRHKRS